MKSIHDTPATNSRDQVATLLARFPGETAASLAGLVGKPDVARLLGVHSATVSRLVRRTGNGFPQPALTLGTRDKWIRGDVLFWIAQQTGGRVTGGGQ